MLNFFVLQGCECYWANPGDLLWCCSQSETGHHGQHGHAHLQVITKPRLCFLISRMNFVSSQLVTRHHGQHSHAYLKVITKPRLGFLISRVNFVSSQSETRHHGQHGHAYLQVITKPRFGFLIGRTNFGSNQSEVVIIWRDVNSSWKENELSACWIRIQSDHRSDLKQIMPELDS